FSHAHACPCPPLRLGKRALRRRRPGPTGRGVLARGPPRAEYRLGGGSGCAAAKESLHCVKRRNSMLKRIHHIDFLVRDMEQAIAQYTRIFGVEIENRVKIQGVDLAYFHIGDVLIALISPVDPRSPLAKQLDEKGEGLMHMGCEVESLEAAVRAMKAKGVRLVNEKPRPGLQDWQIKLIDLVEGQTNGPTIQLVERA